MLGLRGSTGFSLVVGSRGYSLVAAGGLLTVAASLAGEDRLFSTLLGSAVAVSGL